MLHSKDTGRVSKALIEARGDLDKIAMKGGGASTAILAEIHGVLAKHGLCMTQSIVELINTGSTGLETVVIHDSGELVGDAMPVGGEEWNPLTVAPEAVDKIRAIHACMVLGLPLSAKPGAGELPPRMAHKGKAVKTEPEKGDASHEGKGSEAPLPRSKAEGEKNERAKVGDQVEQDEGTDTGLPHDESIPF